jgi:hypothetical protein
MALITGNWFQFISVKQAALAGEKHKLEMFRQGIPWWGLQS